MAVKNYIELYGTTYDLADGVNVASKFSTTTAYNVGDYVINISDGLLYKFIAAHTAGAWNSAEVKKVTIGEDVTQGAAEIADLKSALDINTNVITPSVDDIKNGYYYVNNNSLAFIESGSYYTTEPIDISSLPVGTQISTKASLGAASVGIFITDSHMGVLDYVNGANAASKGYNPGGSSTPLLVTMTIPNNAKYIVTDIRSTSYTNIHDFDISYVSNTIDMLETRVGAIENDITDIDTDIGNAETAITGLSETISQHLYEATPGSTSAFDYSGSINIGSFVRPAGTIGENNSFFYTDIIELRKGDKFNISARASGTSVSWLSRWNSDGTEFLENLQTSARSETSFSYTAMRDVEYLRFSNNIAGGNYHFDVTKTVAARSGYVYELESYIEDVAESVIGTDVVITVGTGKDFTSLVSAIESITDSSEQKKYIILLYEGTYDTVVEADIESGYKGLIIPNYVSIIGIGKRDSIIIRGKITDSAYASYVGDISTINMTMNGHVENVTIESKNLKYCNHDDGTNSSIPGSMISCKKTFRNVKFLVDVVDDGFTVPGYCVGIGAQADKEIRFEECEFVNNASGLRIGVLAHDNAAASQIRGMRMYIENCIFAISNGYDVRLSNSGGTMPSYLYLIGNKMSKPLRFTVSTGVSTNKWKAFCRSNYNYELSNGTEIDISGDVVAFGNVTQ